MTTRQIALAIGAVILLMVLAAGGLMAMAMMAAEDMRAALMDQTRPYILALGVGAMLLSIGLIVFLVRRHESEREAIDSQAEAAFERQLVSEMTFEVKTPSSPSAASAPSPNPPPDATPQPAAQAPTGGETPLSGLLNQLRLAKLDPVTEGEVRRGAFEGSVILRLGSDEAALALVRPPAPEEWESLFPRYDRVFIPLGEGRWVSAERVEGLTRARMDVLL